MKFCSYCGSPNLTRTLPLGDIGIRHACSQCGTIHYQNPNIVAGCVATWEDRLLMCRRAVDPFRGLWTIPAGYLELGETVEEAARRETLEEAGAAVGFLTLMALYNLPMFGEVYLVYGGALAAADIQAGDETLEADLFLPDAIPWDSIAFPMVREAIRFWMQKPLKGDVQTLDFLWGPEGAVRVRR
jgi:ADP-ribose pyrophosphatase YjhB (NUDIX family)